MNNELALPGSDRSGVSRTEAIVVAKARQNLCHRLIVKHIPSTVVLVEAVNRYVRV